MFQNSHIVNPYKTNILRSLWFCSSASPKKGEWRQNQEQELSKYKKGIWWNVLCYCSVVVVGGVSFMECKPLNFFPQPKQGSQGL